VWPGRVAGAQEARVVRGFGLEGADSEGDCGVGCAGAGARQGSSNYEKYVEKDDPEPAMAAGTSDEWADVF